MSRYLICLALILVSGLVVVSAPPLEAHDPLAIPNMLDKVMPGVVTIKTKGVTETGNSSDLSKSIQKKLPKDHPLNDFFKNFEGQKAAESPPKKKQSPSQGSGFVFDSTGLIVTNNHVITKADEVTIVFFDGTTLPASIVGIDQRTDIAVLRVKANKPLTALTFADSSKVRIGEQVIAVGTPYGLGNSATSGMISALKREVGSGPNDFIQVDAAINKGNAGGPLLNLSGGVIGMNTSIYSPSGGSIGISFAIPSNLLKTITTQIVEKGEVDRGWLGVTIQDITAELAESLGMAAQGGALVSGVSSGGPAEKSGFQQGDAIIEVNGITITSSRSLARTIASLPAHERATIVIFRNAKRKTMSVVLGKFPASVAPAKPAAKSSSVPSGPIKVLGMTLEAISGDLRSRFSISKNVRFGVVVTAVDSASAAAEKGVVPGDVIKRVLQADMKKPADVADALQTQVSSGRKSALFLISQGGRERFVALALAGMTVEPIAGKSDSDPAPSTTKQPLNDLEKLD